MIMFYVFFSILHFIVIFREWFFRLFPLIFAEARFLIFDIRYYSDTNLFRMEHYFFKSILSTQSVTILCPENTISLHLEKVIGRMTGKEKEKNEKNIYTVKSWEITLRLSPFVSQAIIRYKLKQISIIKCLLSN